MSTPEDRWTLQYRPPRPSILVVMGRGGTSPRTKLDQVDRVLPGRRQARRVGLPRSRRASPRQDPEGRPLVEGKNVTGFTNGEEEEVGLTKVVPFLVEDELMSLGAAFSKIKNWGVYTVADGQLITGENPASSGTTARVLIERLKQKAK